MYLAHTIDQFLTSESAMKAIKNQYQDNPDSFFSLSTEELEHITKSLCGFYRSLLEESGLQGYVIGLSGGVDSAVVASLLVKAVGADHVKGLILPSRFTSKEHIYNAEKIAKQLDIKTNDSSSFASRFHDALDAILELTEESSGDDEIDRIRTGNIQARLRMIILRDYAKKYNYLVVGTGNATEELLGYFTLAGDGLGGIDNEGVASLYKTQIRALARHLEVPESIISIPPTAGLYDGQNDEREIGASYEAIDLILIGYKMNMSEDEVAEILNQKSIPRKIVKHIFSFAKTNAFKTKLPPQAVIKMRD